MSCSRGDKLRVELFGASHADAVGVTVEGLPAGERVDPDALRLFLARRAPGRSPLSTARTEPDEPRFLGGLTDGRTDGTPLTAVIENTDRRSADYEAFRDVPRPGHADYTASVKYGGRCDLRGGGAFSGRMTAPLCVAGGICLQLLERRGVRVAAHILSVGEITDEPFDPMGADAEMLDALKARELPVLSYEAGEAMRASILAATAEGDSLGGVVECLVTGLPAGLGGPLFEGLEGALAAMLFAVPAVKGVEFGAGFGAARLRGSENNDAFAVRDGRIVTETNHAGGILGGISDGMPLLFRAAFKPTPSIARPQKSVRLSSMEETELVIAGRHDPCIVPRAVPVVEAAAAIVLLDKLLAAQGETGPSGLDALRAGIDRVDEHLVPLLAERMALSGEIGRVKQEQGLPVRDAERESRLLRRLRALAGEKDAGSVEAVYRAILAESRARQEEKRNILLVGMPGCGKSTVGAALAEAAGRRFADLDARIAERAGRSIPEIFAAEGEEGFRRLEHELLCETLRENGLVVAAGGGVVTRPENIKLMRQNARVVWLLRDLDKLPTGERPLSQSRQLSELWREREPLYRAAAEEIVDNNGTVEETVRQIIEGL